MPEPRLPQKTVNDGHPQIDLYFLNRIPNTRLPQMIMFVIICSSLLDETRLLGTLLIRQLVHKMLTEHLRNCPRSHSQNIECSMEAEYIMHCNEQ